jgi:lytic murein transglycosylase
LTTLRPQALSEGVTALTFDRVVPTVMFNRRVIELDRAQPGGNPNAPAGAPAFAPYRDRHVTPALIARGQRRYTSLRPLLMGIERQTGVPESIMLGIYGNETGFGGFTGSSDLLSSLATLAYEGRRRELFTREFIATLKLIDRGIPREQLKGSWAGATGYPQFLPTMYLRLGKDGDGDGRVDIWTNEADAMASIANYFVHAGWKPNVVWGVTVRVPAGFDRSAVAAKLVSPRCPRVYQRHSRWLTVAEWRQRGIEITGANPPADDQQASLLEPDGPGATAYLLSGNYRVILDYNCSNFYGLSVGLLADAVAR